MFGKPAFIPYNKHNESSLTIAGSLISSFSYLLTFNIIIYAIFVSFGSTSQYSSMQQITTQYIDTSNKNKQTLSNTLPVFLIFQPSDTTPAPILINNKLTIRYALKKYKNDFATGERKLVDLKYEYAISCEKFANIIYQDASDSDRKLLADNISQRGLCHPDLLSSNWKIYGSSSDEEYQTISLEVLPCIPEENTQCVVYLYPYSPYSIAWSEFYQNLENQNEPIKSSLLIDDLFTDPHKEVEQELYLKENIMTDNFIELPGLTLSHKISFTDNEKEIHRSISRNSTILSCTKENIEDRKACPPYYTFIMRASRKQVNIIRNYLQITDIIGEYGGLIEIVFIFATLLGLFLSIFSEKDQMKRDFGLLESEEEFEGLISNPIKKQYHVKYENIDKILSEFFEVNFFKSSKLKISTINRMFLAQEHLILLPLLRVIILKGISQRQPSLRSLMTVTAAAPHQSILEQDFSDLNDKNNQVKKRMNVVKFKPKKKKREFLKMKKQKVKKNDESKILNKKKNRKKKVQSLNQTSGLKMQIELTSIPNK